MRITPSTVRQMADYAKEVSRGAFWLYGHRPPIDSFGARYIDGATETVWTGPNGAARAAAYYIGIIDTYRILMGSGEYRDDVKAAREAALARPSGKEWRVRGMSDARKAIRAAEGK
ncbi:hypothetical protein [Streptomyces tsukubensis]|uniref:hypothetical protein n=1 Tax=Streptomyces tsukubensis TaxID=83656 RepID=UPI00344E1040